MKRLCSGLPKTRLYLSESLPTSSIIEILVHNLVKLDSYQQGSYSKAESQMRRALKLNSDNAYASYYLGLCLLHDGKIGEAKQQFETAQTIAHGSKFMTRNEPLEEEASAALERLGQPTESH